MPCDTVVHRIGYAQSVFAATTSGRPEFAAGLSGNKEVAAFLKKKRRKKLLFGWACGGETSTAQFNKVFLLLFVHKKKPSSSLRYGLS
jgi:hypothetical protein